MRAMNPVPLAGAAPARTISVAEALQMAAAHFQAGQRGEVEVLCLKVLELEPENPAALHLLGVLAHLAGKQGVALALIEKAVRCEPRNAQFRYNLGVVYGVLRRLEEALAAYREAVALDPEHPNAWSNLGSTALDLDHFDQALAAYDAVLARHPGNPGAALARAIILYAMRRFDAAGPAYQRALALAPRDPRARWEYAHHLLMTGDYAAGWEEYEFRFSAGAQSSVWCYPYPYPRWQGEPLAGKTILLHGEQGLGDEIMFASIYPEVIAAAAHTIIACQPHLLPLFRDSFPGAQLVPQLRNEADAWTRRPADWVAEAPRIDYEIPFGSLARLRRRALADFPVHRPDAPGQSAGLAAGQVGQVAGQAGQAAGQAGQAGRRGHEAGQASQKAGQAGQAPGQAAGPASVHPAAYLRADPVKCAAWQAKLADLRGLRVGLCWAANPAVEDALAARRARKKSLTLRQLEPLLNIEGVDFISLQTWEAAAQVAAADPGTRARILDASAGLGDFADTAALIMNLDLVITVDTSVAHLAGALGQPVWILLPWQADWRWHAQGSRSEWYPQARLYRQPALGDWESVIRQAHLDLNTLRGAAPAGASTSASTRAPAGAPTGLPTSAPTSTSASASETEIPA